MGSIAVDIPSNHILRLLGAKVSFLELSLRKLRPTSIAHKWPLCNKGGAIMGNGGPLTPGAGSTETVNAPPFILCDWHLCARLGCQSWFLGGVSFSSISWMPPPGDVDKKLIKTNSLPGVVTIFAAFMKSFASLIAVRLFLGMWNDTMSPRCWNMTPWWSPICIQEYARVACYPE